MPTTSTAAAPRSARLHRAMAGILLALPAVRQGANRTGPVRPASPQMAGRGCPAVRRARWAGEPRPPLLIGDARHAQRHPEGNDNELRRATTRSHVPPDDVPAWLGIGGDRL